MVHGKERGEWGMEGGTNLVGQSDELPQKLISINQWVPNTGECTCDFHC